MDKPEMINESILVIGSDVAGINCSMNAADLPVMKQMIEELDLEKL